MTLSNMLADFLTSTLATSTPEERKQYLDQFMGLTCQDKQAIVNGVLNRPELVFPTILAEWEQKRGFIRQKVEQIPSEDGRTGFTRYRYTNGLVLQDYSEEFYFCVRIHWFHPDAVIPEGDERPSGSVQCGHTTRDLITTAEELEAFFQKAIQFWERQHANFTSVVAEYRYILDQVESLKG